MLKLFHREWANWSSSRLKAGPLFDHRAFVEEAA
jgi:hypothetical protein